MSRLYVIQTSCDVRLAWSEGELRTIGSLCVGNDFFLFGLSRTNIIRSLFRCLFFFPHRIFRSKKINIQTTAPLFTDYKLGGDRMEGNKSILKLFFSSVFPTLL